MKAARLCYSAGKAVFGRLDRRTHMTDITCMGEIVVGLAQIGFHESGAPLFAANVAAAARQGGLRLP